MNAKAVFRSLLLSALVIASAVGQARSETLRFGSDPGDYGWRRATLPGKPASTFVGQADGSLVVKSDAGVAFLYRMLDDRLAGHGKLSWRWRVDMATTVTDLGRAGGDDRPLAIHVWFPEPEKDRSVFDGIIDGVRDTFGVPTAGRALTYVFGGRGDRGDWLANPYMADDGRIIILRPGDAEHGRWYRESVDIAADFRAAFGYAPPPAAFVAISADFDDSGGAGMGILADLALSEGPDIGSLTR